MANPWYDSIQAAALARCPAILSDWLPGGRLNGREYECGSISGGAGNSLRVSTVKGLFKDFASGEPGGNLIGLYAQIRHIEYREAARDLADQWGIERPAPLKLAPAVWEPVTPIPDWAPMTDEGLPDVPARQDGSEVRGAWLYLSGAAEPLCWRFRLEKPNADKDVLPLTFCRNRDTGATAWRWRDLPAPRPLFGLEMLAALPDAPVLIVEGEKTAEAATRMLPDWVVVTWPGGTQRVSTKHTDWSPVAVRAGRVVVWPDNDEPGMRAAAQIADFLKCAVVRCDPGWRKAWDLADAEAEGWDGSRALAYLEGHLLLPQTPPPAERVDCEISGSDLDVRSQATFGAVGTVNVAPNQTLFRTDGEVTILQNGLRFAADIPRARQWLTSRIRFMAHDKEGNLRSTTPADKLIENVLIYDPSPLPKLKRLVRRPVFTSERRLITEPGHDPASGLFYLPAPDLEGLDVDTDVGAAIALIDDLFCDFHFEAASDRAHLYAMLLQPAFRELIEGPTPLYRFEAPQPGTGKGLLFETAALLLFETGWPFITTPSTEEEWGKALLGHLRNGPEVLLLDNCHNLRSYHLAAALTAWPYWSGRLLYQQGSFHVPIRNVWAATMNNPQFSPEIYRRTVRIRITPGGVEKPEERTKFVHDPILEYAASQRRPLVEALLTLAVAGLANHKPFTERRLGSFESWTRVMGGVLAGLGIEHFLEREKNDMGEDRQSWAWSAFLAAWAKQWGNRRMRVRELLTVAQDTDLDLGHGNDLSQMQRLGRLLMEHRGVTNGGFKVVAEPDKHTRQMWYVLEGATEVNWENGQSQEF